MSEIDFLMLFYAHKTANPDDGLTSDQRVQSIIKHLGLVKSVLSIVDWDSLEPNQSVESEEKGRAAKMLGDKHTRKMEALTK